MGFLGHATTAQAAFLLAACNQAPLLWNDYGLANGAAAEWGTPTDEVCLDLGETDSEPINGFLFCTPGIGPTPIDDPIFARCDARDRPPGLEVFFQFDGARAKAWPLPVVREREIFHDVWEGTDIVGVF